MEKNFLKKITKQMKTFQYAAFEMECLNNLGIIDDHYGGVNHRLNTIVPISAKFLMLSDPYLSFSIE